MNRLRLVTSEASAHDQNIDSVVEESYYDKIERTVVRDIEGTPTISSHQADIATARALSDLFAKCIEP